MHQALPRDFESSVAIHFSWHHPFRSRVATTLATLRSRLLRGLDDAPRARYFDDRPPARLIINCMIPTRQHSATANHRLHRISSAIARAVGSNPANLRLCITPRRLRLTIETGTNQPTNQNSPLHEGVLVRGVLLERLLPRGEGRHVHVVEYRGWHSAAAAAAADRARSSAGRRE